MWHLIAVAKRQYRVRRAINELTLRWTCRSVYEKLRLATNGVGFGPIRMVAGPRGGSVVLEREEMTCTWVQDKARGKQGDENTAEFAIFGK